MSQQSAKSLPRVSPEKDFRRELRTGQSKLKRHLEELNPEYINFRWPGGYGKTIGIALGFRHAIINGTCNRLLIVVANDTQRRQVIADFEQDALDVALHVGKPWAFTSDVATFKANRRGVNVVFVTTIQQVSACNRTSENMLLSMMRDHGDWMLACDEYHHYAEDCDWGNSLSILVDSAAFVMACSATPERDGNPTIFGDDEPLVAVRLEDAIKEKALKQIYNNQYVYRMDYINKSGEPVQFDTCELRESGVGIKYNLSEFEAKKELRYSAKYVTPLVHEPLMRLVRKRERHGLPLQMLVRAMSCGHAQTLCKQIRTLCGELSVDWIGTGTDGRSDIENRAVKDRFCPAKDKHGKRGKPSLDILVQVGMADEGFDSLYVAEIVDYAIVLCDGASNRTKQFIYRGTRYVEGVCLDVNFGSDHPLSGKDLVEWLQSGNFMPAPEDTGEKRDVDLDWDLDDWSEDWFTNEHLVNAELVEVITDPRFKDVVKEHRPDATDSQIDDWFKQAMKRDMEAKQVEYTREEMRTKIDKLVGRVAYCVVKSDGEFEASKLRDIKKRINGRMKRAFGERSSLVEDELLGCYRWLRSLYEQVVNQEFPGWLIAR